MIVLSFRFVFGVVLLMVQWKVWLLDMFVSESLADQLLYWHKLCLEHVFLVCLMFVMVCKVGSTSFQTQLQLGSEKIS